MKRKEITAISANGNAVFSRRFSLICFLFLSLEYVLLFPRKEALSDWVLTHYLLNYKNGFQSRSLVGSVFSLFGEYATYKMFYIFVSVIVFIMLCLISLILGKIISRFSFEKSEYVTIFAVLFLASPYSITYFFGPHMGRLDMYWFIYTLLGLMMMKNKILRWLLPILCFVALATHQGYMVTYMPALCIPLLYEIYKNKNSKKSIALFSIVCITLIGLFFFFQFGLTKTTFSSAEEYCDQLKQSSEYVISYAMIQLEFFAKFPDWFTGYVKPLTESFVVPFMIVNIVAYIPYIAVFSFIWKNSIKKAEDKFLKFIIALCMLAPLMFIPAAIFGNDLDRWWAATVNVQFFIAFYFLYSNEKAVVGSVLNVCRFLKKHLILFVMIIIFSNALTFSNFPPFIIKICDKQVFYDYFGYYKGYK